MKRTHATQLRDGLKTLGLATIRECYREQADLARKEALPYEGYLLELINRECETRAHNRIQRLLRESRLPLEKNLDTFDRTRLPTKVDGLVATLLQGDFLDRSENVLAFGNRPAPDPGRTPGPVHALQYPGPATPSRQAGSGSPAAPQTLRPF